MACIVAIIHIATVVIVLKNFYLCMGKTVYLEEMCTIGPRVLGPRSIIVGHLESCSFMQYFGLYNICHGLEDAAVMVEVVAIHVPK